MSFTLALNSRLWQCMTADKRETSNMHCDTAAFQFATLQSKIFYVVPKLQLKKIPEVEGALLS